MSQKQDEQIEFTFSGQPPLIVPVGAPKVVNLDADKLDGETASDFHDASKLDSGLIPLARLATSGTPGPSTFLNGNREWVAPTSGGRVFLYDLKTSGVAGIVDTFPAYTITHNLGAAGIPHYCAIITNNRAGNGWVQDFIVPYSAPDGSATDLWEQSQPPIHQIKIGTNTVSILFHFDIDVFPSPTALAVGQINVFLIAP